MLLATSVACAAAGRSRSRPEPRIDWCLDVRIPFFHDEIKIWLSVGQHGSPRIGTIAKLLGLKNRLSLRLRFGRHAKCLRIDRELGQSLTRGTVGVMHQHLGQPHEERVVVRV
jgi:hypothetical protein